jgi:hypothetical protein
LWVSVPYAQQQTVVNFAANTQSRVNGENAKGQDDEWEPNICGSGFLGY